jgi:hypothetical protein
MLAIGKLLTDETGRITVQRVLSVETGSIRAVLDITRGPYRLSPRL